MIFLNFVTSYFVFLPFNICNNTDEFILPTNGLYTFKAIRIFRTNYNHLIHFCLQLLSENISSRPNILYIRDCLALKHTIILGDIGTETIFTFAKIFPRTNKSFRTKSACLVLLSNLFVITVSELVKIIRKPIIVRLPIPFQLKVRLSFRVKFKILFSSIFKKLKHQIGFDMYNNDNQSGQCFPLLQFLETSLETKVF